jgi:hypothetical protein
MQGRDNPSLSGIGRLRHTGKTQKVPLANSLKMWHTRFRLTECIEWFGGDRMLNGTQDMSGSNGKPDMNSDVTDVSSVEVESKVDLAPSHPPHKRSLLGKPPHKYPPPPHHHPSHHRELKGLNSLLSETLGELLPTFQDIQTIEAVVRELDEDAFPIFRRVVGEGITNPIEFVRRFLEIEATESIKIRNLMVADLKRNLAVVLFPLPPYITELVRPVLPRDFSFNTTEHAQVHIKRDNIPFLDFDRYRDLLSVTTPIDTLILDGQRLHNILTVRSNAASILELFLNRSLKKIYLHKIPHLPRGERFVTLDISQHDVELYNI